MPKIEYEINGNGLNTLNPVVTNQGHGRGQFYASSDHFALVDDADACTILVHKNQSSGSYAIILYANGLFDGRGKKAVTWDFTRTISVGQIFVKDDEPSIGGTDNYGSNSIEHAWTEGGGDGWAVKVSDMWPEVEFSLTERNYNDYDADPEEFRLVTDNTGSTVTAGTATNWGTIRLKFNSEADSPDEFDGDEPLRTGDKVVMLREDLAHQ